MKDKLFPLRFNELLDDAPRFRRERTLSAAGLASSFKNSRHTQSQIPQLSTDSMARAATHNANTFKFSPAAQRLTLELTRADEQPSVYAARKDDEKHSIEASG
jgi:hypothetical protein